MILRNTAEFVGILLIWAGFQMSYQMGLTGTLSIVLLITISLSKTLFFGMENIRQLFEATRCNQAYHRFMLIMLVNMTQIILSFGLDFHCLQTVNPQSFSVEPQQTMSAEAVFEFVYFSTLNFTFFGYGDVTPQTIPAKFITMTEIVLAFVTVIFLLSDFISLKESLAWKEQPASTNANLKPPVDTAPSGPT
jgi:hypothetical protein